MTTHTVTSTVGEYSVLKVFVGRDNKMYFDHCIRCEPDGKYQLFSWVDRDTSYHIDNVWQTPCGVFDTVDAALLACELLGSRD